MNEKYRPITNVLNELVKTSKKPKKVHENVFEHYPVYDENVDDNRSFSEMDCFECQESDAENENIDINMEDIDIGGPSNIDGSAKRSREDDEISAAISSELDDDDETLITPTSHGKKSRGSKSDRDKLRNNAAKKTNKTLMQMRNVNKILMNVQEKKRDAANEKLNHYYVLTDRGEGDDDSVVTISDDDDIVERYPPEKRGKQPQGPDKFIKVPATTLAQKLHGRYSKSELQTMKKRFGGYNLKRVARLPKLQNTPSVVLYSKPAISNPFLTQEERIKRAQQVPIESQLAAAASEAAGIQKKEKKKRGKKGVKSGKGIETDFIPYNEHIAYEFYDDPNELCERLRIMIASRSAGNSNHSQEINSIVAELREAAIIK